MKPKYKNYKLRAECFGDVVQLVQKLGQHSHTAIKSFKTDFVFLEPECRLPDCTFEFKSTLSLEEVLKLIAKITDGHVMYETLELKENYTGERRDDRRTA